MFYNFFKAALNGELRAHPLKKTSTMLARSSTPDSINTSTDNLSLPQVQSTEETVMSEYDL